MNKEETRTRREATGGAEGGRGGWLESPPLNITDCILNAKLPECETDGLVANYNTSGNATLAGDQEKLPASLSFDDNARTDIIVYSILFVIAAAGNLTVFITLWRNRHRKSRVNLMIMHLAAADLMVTFINFPLEISWLATTQWLAGNLACKIFLFFRAFGLYLSSLVLVCISLDRYFAIVHPLKVNDAQRRGKMMVCLAWSVAAVCSLPQSIIFHVDSHPEFSQFKQCVTFGFFSSQVQETMYNLFCLAAMYFLPLLIIIIVYFRILWEIYQNSKNSAEPKRRENRSSIIKATRERRRGSTTSRRETGGSRTGEKMRLRRSDTSNIERARSRTLKMTVIIVLAFVWCWTPYVVIVLWYMFDRASAEQVESRLQNILFIMAVSNSCVNPIVYGTYTINLRAELDRCFGRRRGRGGGGAGGGISSVRNTTRRSAGPSFAPRSTITKTSYTQISNPAPNKRGSGCVLLEIEGDPSPTVPGNTSGSETTTKDRLCYEEIHDSGPDVQLTPLAPLRSQVNERSLVQNGSSNAGLMLTAC